MIPKELIQKIKHIEISTKRQVTELMGGRYESVFKGQGIEFADVREYQYGDDVRAIDWNVTARQKSPFIKQHMEERELTVMLLVDLSASLSFSTRNQRKRDLIAEIAALLAFSAIRNNDKVGMLLFSDKVEKFVPPGKQRQHILRIVRDILYYQPDNQGTSIQTALDYMACVVRKRTITFLLSDFFDNNYETSLKRLARRHDLIPIVMEDPFEQNLPACGYIQLEDAETGQTIEINSRNKQAQKQYRANYLALSEERRRIFKQCGIAPIEINTEQSYIQPIAAYFKKRARK